MEELTLQQVLNLRATQMEFINNKREYMNIYRKIIKKFYTTELTELTHSEFNMVDVELKVPELPPLPQENKPTQLFQLSQLEDLYDATVEGLAML